MHSILRFGFCTFVLLHLSSVNYREIPSCFHKKIKLHNYANLIFFLEEKYIMTLSQKILTLHLFIFSCGIPLFHVVTKYPS